MTLRNFVNGAPLITLSVAVNTSAVTLSVASTAGYPAAPFTIALERGTVNEEVVLCTALNATTFTVIRGWDGTTAKNHSIGAAIEHTSAAIDYNEANAHVNDTTTDVHPQYVTKAAYTAKGKVLVGTGVGTLTALTVGANETVHLADSAAASGTKWGTIGAASITDGVITDAKLATATQESLIRRQASYPTATEGSMFFHTGNSRWYGYRGAWQRMTFGAGYISWGTAAPSGGVDGDIYFRY
jgi:hypothetical protein